MTKVVIVGGNAAGLSAASRIKKFKPEWELTVYEKGEYVSYGGCGLPYYVQGLVKELGHLITLTPEDVIQKRKIPLKLHHEVVSADFKNKTITVRDLKEGIEKNESYDYLFLGTGAKPTIPENFEVDSRHPRVVEVHTLNQSQEIRNMLENSNGNIKTVAIVGVGFIGQEMFQAYKRFESIKDIIGIGPLRPFTGKLEEIFEAKLKDKNIKHINQYVENVSELEDGKLKITMGNGDNIEADLVQYSVGVSPNTKPFKDSGLKMLKNGAIVIDEFCKTSVDSVYAAGDCATVKHKIIGKDHYIPLAPAANRLGRLAGNHIAGTNPDPFPGVVGTAIWKCFDLHCAQTGINQTLAEKLNLNAESVTITNREVAHYYPSDNKMTISLRFNPETHKILGCEIIADSTMGAKKIDVIATALAAEMTIDDLQKLDLGYAPPFSPVYDPVLIAANVARKKCK